MTFYLRPPEGTVPVHLFQIYAESRLKFLIALVKNPNIDIEELLRINALEIPRLDALIGGSSIDRLAHFALRSIAILDPNLIHYVHKWEVELFRRRLLTSTSSKDLDTIIRQLLRHLRHFLPFLDTVKGISIPETLELKRNAKFLKLTFRILMDMAKKRQFQCHDHFVGDVSPKICPKHGNNIVLTIPFTQVLQLLSTLDVTLVMGYAHLQCHKIPVYLEIIFAKLLETSTNLMKATSCWSRLRSDIRLREARASLRRVFNSHGYYFPEQDVVSFGAAIAAGESLNYETLLAAIKNFPPCMASMFKSLRIHHRLCHQSRVQLTLFLKSIFVPLEVTLRLLQEEYSQTVSPAQSRSTTVRSHSCGHSWHTDSRRYIYGTRHLYGLEGSRKNYSVDSCFQIQNSSSFQSCGGCPFVQSKETQLCILSDDLNSESSAKKFMHRNVGEDGKVLEVSPIETCHQYLWFKVRELQCQKGNVVKVRKGIDTYQSGTCTSDKTKDFPNENHPTQAKTGMISKPTDFYNIIKKLL